MTLVNHVAQYLMTASILHRPLLATQPNHMALLLHSPLIRHPVHEYLYNALSSQPGLFVHWGVYGSGKTISACETARRLRAEGRTVVCLSGYDPSAWTAPTLREWVKQSCPSSAAATLIINDFAPLMKLKEGAIELLEELASDSAATFNALLCLTSWEWAMDIMRLPCAPKLIGFPGCGRWNQAQIEEMAESLGMDPCSGPVFDSVKSGTPIFPPAQSGSYYSRRAATLEAEWQKGIQALSSSLPSDAFTIPMTYVEDSYYYNPAKCLLGRGTFPDRNGHFALI